mgnify:CR=1 FL=1
MENILNLIPKIEIYMFKYLRQIVNFNEYFKGDSHLIVSKHDLRFYTERIIIKVHIKKYFLYSAV